jgi:trehalose-6-phosphate synthase
LLAYYQIADTALLTPIRDGMNLIAKEYIAARKEPGVLILSEFAGAAEELNEAIIVNPYDRQSTADALKTSLLMPEEEKRYRFEEMRKKVRDHNSEWWLNRFIEIWMQYYQKKNITDMEPE